MSLVKIQVLICILFLFVKFGLAQVSADFTVNDSVGCNALIVQFQNASVGDGTLLYQWDFGNGTTSTIENPQVVFNTVGAYTITLIVSNTESVDTLKKDNFIVVYKSPEVLSILADSAVGCTPLTVTFQANVVQGSSEIKTFVWDFGNNNSSFLQEPTNTYANSGNYTVSVYVLDSNNCDFSFSSNDLIHALSKPSPNFSAEHHLACTDTLTVDFQNNSQGNGELSYLWNFGDGSSSLLESPIKFYTGFNNYTVSLVVTDEYGCVNELIKTEFVKMQELLISAQILDDQLCKYESLQLLNTTQGANAHHWNFGDGTTSNQLLPDKSYTESGIFLITYVASFSNFCFDTLQHEVFVDPVEASFISDEHYGCEFPFAVHYTNTSTGAANAKWLFGNGSVSYIYNPTKQYQSSSTLIKERNLYLTDTLIAESALHCKDTFIIDSNVHLYLPEVYFTPNDSSQYTSLISGCVPLTIGFSNKSRSFYDDDPFVDLYWDFGNGIGSNEENPTNTYSEVGEYDVTLTITNQSGCENEYSAAIKLGNPQNAFFNYDGNDTICGSEQVELTDASSDGELIDAWNWIFSDGSFSNEQNPVVQFVDTGFVSAILSVSFNHCASEQFKLDSFVYLNGPAGKVNVFMNCNEPLLYSFNAELEDFDRLYYNFGDGNIDSSSNSEVVHTYSEGGDFNAYVEAFNTQSTCSLTIDKEIFVRELHADYSYSPERQCPGEAFLFDPSKTIDNAFFVFNGQIGKFLWEFGDTTLQFMSLDEIEHVYLESGLFDVKLNVQDVNGCKKQAVKSIRVMNVDAGFGYADSVGCAPVSIDFSDQSIADTTIESWIWNFGNGQSSSEQNPTATFEDDGSFNISLIVSDALGCMDTLIKQSAIFSSNPIADFNAINTNSCFNDSIQFINLSSGAKIKEYSWNFGEGLTSNEEEPKIVFNDTGYFDVSLWIIDSIGCDTQINKQNYIYIQPIPIADFTSNSFSSNCYPSIIGFIDASVSDDITQRIWNFGDGSESYNTISPFHTYQFPGFFDVSLKVTTSLGCSNEIIKEDIVEIGGPNANIIMPDSACINLPLLHYFDNPINVNNFNWTLNDGSNSNSNPLYKTYNEFGVKQCFLYLQSDSLGTCNKILTDSFEIHRIKSDFILEDSAQCTPLNTSLLNTSINVAEYKWYVDGAFESDEKEKEIEIYDVGNHSIKLVVKSNEACLDSIAKSAIVYPLPDVNLNNDTLICQFDSIWLEASNGMNYWWFENNKVIDSLTSLIQVSPNSNSNYLVRVENIWGCLNADSVDVDVKPKPEITIVNSDTTLVIGEGLELQGVHSYADDFYWEPAEEVSCFNCDQTMILPLENTIIYFKGADNLGCFLVLDSVHITVDAKYSVDVPSSFSPNGDGINDVLYVKGWGIKELKSFSVYDLHGKIVFKSNNINVGWDGNSKYGKQPNGMYLYSLQVISYDNATRNKQGHFYIID